MSACPCAVAHDGACLLTAPDDVREAAWPVPTTAAPAGRPVLTARGAR